MAVQRQANLLGQQRLDIPHVRAIESSICADFDAFGGLAMAGGTPQIVKGFTLVTTGAVGSPAANLAVVVSGSTVLHYTASESGSIFTVPAGRANEVLNSVNTNVVGSFAASSTNYIGFDMIRSADQTTADLVQFLDANTLLETPKTVPLARTLNYRFIVSTAPFSASSNICPIAKVTTDASNNVLTVVDARPMLFRLGTGGDIPSASYFWPFPQGRNETTAIDVFSGGDKSFGSFSDFAKGIMTRMWELGGGEYWYSASSDRNVKLLGEGTAMSNGDYFTWDGTYLTFQGLVIVFNNSTGWYNEVANLLSGTVGTNDLQLGECLYVDLDRTTNRTRAGSPLNVAKGVTATLGAPAVPGSRFVIAWRTNNGNVIVRDRPYQAGQTLTLATNTAAGAVQLSGSGYASPPQVAVLDASTGFARSAGLIRDANANVGVGSLTYKSSVTTSGAVVAHIFDNSLTLSTTGDKLMSVRNNTTEAFAVDLNGRPIINGRLFAVTLPVPSIGVLKANNAATYTIVTGSIFQTATWGVSSFTGPGLSAGTSSMVVAANYAGTYRVKVCGSFSSNTAAQIVQFGIYKNGVQQDFVRVDATATGTAYGFAIEQVYSLAAADIMTIQVTSSTAGCILTVQGGIYFVMDRVF